MWLDDYQWHYDYVRLAWDTGFSFEKFKSPNLDKNKICVVDVDRIVKERDVASVERYISTVVQYILEDEQAKVLDTNFVKIFRICQLAVEYLLFCKKYLDNTVVLLKKELAKNREENKQLEDLIKDLQTHIDTLSRQQVFATFKCSFCSKVFSSEDYLNSHIKRRHNELENYNSETDKLNMEIKELKERLNNTEKLLKEKSEGNSKDMYSETNKDNAKMTELVDTFQRFKDQIYDELKEWKNQKTFYEENYGKLFDIVIQNKENVEPKRNLLNTAKTETTTQTDKLLQIENVTDKNITEIREEISKSNGEDNIIELEHNKETLESKITTTLAGIESRMQTFWDKLQEIEQRNKQSVETAVKTELGSTMEVKPKAKPRSKLSLPTQNTLIVDNTDQLKTVIDNLENRQQHKRISRQINLEKECSEEIVYTNSPETKNEAEHLQFSKASKAKIEEEEFSSESDVDSGSSESSISEVVTKQEAASSKIVTKPSPAKSIDILNKEIETVICSRLRQLGIPDNWTKLSEKVFDKSLEIINHQAKLTKKEYSSFSSIKKKLIKDIDKMAVTKLGNKAHLESNSKPKLKKLQNVVKLSYRPKTENNTTLEKRNATSNNKKESIEIKNRALYDTDDTESEPNFKQNANKSPTKVAYSSVIQELNSKLHTNSSSTDESSKNHQKGVLKSFTSAGSLSRKKVFFDIESESSKIEDIPVIQKAGGSTTSIASSILEEKVDRVNIKQKEEKEDIRKVEKELHDLSDLDFSDL